jgi:hypothetical protein
VIQCLTCNVMKKGHNYTRHGTAQEGQDEMAEDDKRGEVDMLKCHFCRYKNELLFI